MMRRGRPGLIGTMARTAVVAGTATAVSGKVASHQQEKAYEKQAEAYEKQAEMQAAQQAAAAAAAPAAAGESMDEKIAQLERLAELQKQGILTPEELATQKARILGS